MFYTEDQFAKATLIESLTGDSGHLDVCGKDMFVSSVCRWNYAVTVFKPRTGWLRKKPKLLGVLNERGDLLRFRGLVPEATYQTHGVPPHGFTEAPSRDRALAEATALWNTYKAIQPGPSFSVAVEDLV